MQSPVTLTQSSAPVTTYPIYCEKLAKYDFLQLSPKRFLSEIDDLPQHELESFRDSWNTLEVDQHMADGGTYRMRRHGTFSASRAGGGIAREAHQPHYQTTTFNDLNGGIQRHFAPLEDHVADGKVLKLCVAQFWHAVAHV